MTFFAQQEKRKRHGAFLIFLFVFAIFFNALVGYLSAKIIQYVFVHKYVNAGFLKVHFLRSLSFSNPQNQFQFWMCVGFTLLVVLISAFWKIHLSSQKGDYVAQHMGATSIAPSTLDATEKKLINVTEEMSLASGVPIPMVFVLKQEDTLNAFITGSDLNNAVLTVTQGLLDHLDRDELQAVVAHEYGHLQSNDMRLQLILTGFIYGLQSLRVWGLRILRTRLFYLGLPLMAVGYFGHFTATLIQRAISRQREFLADQYAVQFTRYPKSLIQALRKIALKTGILKNRYAENIAHVLFAEGVQKSWSHFFSTHPSLEARIREIDVRAAKEFADTPGLHASYLKRAEEVPLPLVEQCHDLEASEQVFESFFSPDPSQSLATMNRFSVFTLLMPTLKLYTQERKQKLKEKILKRAKEDGVLSFQEWMYYWLYVDQVLEHKTKQVRNIRLQSAKKELGVFFSKIYELQTNGSEVQFQNLVQRGVGRSLEISFHSHVPLQAFHGSLETLQGLGRSQKEDVLQTVLTLITTDETLKVEEIELLRLLGVAFQIPVPPLDPEKKKTLTFE